MSVFTQSERESSLNSAQSKRDSEKTLQHPSYSIKDYGSSSLLKPDKVKKFQEKERNILEQSILSSATQDISSSHGYADILQYSNEDGYRNASKMWSSVDHRNQQDPMMENNRVNLSSGDFWSKSGPFSHNSLSPPTSAFKKKDSICSSTKKRRGRVKFDLDVEVHVVPRDSYQPSPADSSEAYQSDTDDSYLSVDNHDAEEEETNDNFNSFSSNLERDTYKSYFTTTTSTDSYELNPSTFGKLSINTAVTPFRVIKREESPGGRSMLKISGGTGSGRRDSIDLIQMQRLLKQQAKDRAFSASLPQISYKKDSRQLIKSLQGRFQQQSNALIEETKPAPNSANAGTGRQSTSKRYANSFSSYGNRQISTYAHMQLQKQYKEWEERRKKKKKSSEMHQSSSPSLLDTQSTTDSLSSPRAALSPRIKHDEQTQDTIKRASSCGGSTEKKRNLELKVTNKNTKLSNRQNMSSPLTGNLSDSETPSLKRFRPMTTDFRDFKLKTISRSRKPPRRNSFKQAGLFDNITKKNSVAQLSSAKANDIDMCDENSAKNAEKIVAVLPFNGKDNGSSLTSYDAILPRPSSNSVAQRGPFRNDFRTTSSHSSNRSRIILSKSVMQSCDILPTTTSAAVTLKSLGLTVHHPRGQEMKVNGGENYLRKVKNVKQSKSSVPPASGQHFSTFREERFSSLTTNTASTRTNIDPRQTLYDDKRFAEDTSFVLSSNAIS